MKLKMNGLSFLIALLMFNTKIQANFPDTTGVFYAGADWIYWQAKQEGLTAGEFVDDFINPIFKHVDIINFKPEFTYRSGFEVYAGYLLPGKLWDVSAGYAHLPFRSKTVTMAGDASLPSDHQQYIVLSVTNFPVLASFAPNQITAVVESLSESWYGNLNFFDLDLERTILFCNRFSLSPHFGFRAIWGDEKVNMASLFAFPAINGATSGVLDITQEYQGYGLEAGFNLGWNIGCGFSLLGHAGGSMLYSSFNVKQVVKEYLDGAQTFQLNDKYKECLVNPTMEYAVALEYATRCYCFPLSFYLGWDALVLFDFNQFTTEGGNFTAQGLTLGCDFGF